MRKLSDEPDFVFDIREDFRFYEQKTKLLIGWPGYRTLPGKSGLGYIETYAEEARIEGLFVRWLFTGKFRTHNPIYLLILFLFGMVAGGIPLMLIGASLVLSGDFGALGVLILASPTIFTGMAILVNVWLSINDPNGESITGD